jgi:hypothetical protein
VTQENPLETLQCTQEFLTLGNCDVENINKWWICSGGLISGFQIWQERMNDNIHALYVGILLRTNIPRMYS